MYHEETEEHRKKRIRELAEDFPHLPNEAFLRLNDVLALNIVGCSKATLYRMMENGRFPPTEKISENIVGIRIGRIRSWQKNPVNWEASND